MPENSYWNDNSFKIYQPFFRAAMENYRQQMVFSPAQMLFYSFYMPEDAAGSGECICVPDGCISMTFIYNEDEYLLEIAGSPLARKTIRAYPAHHYLGVRFKPGMFLKFSGMTIAEMANNETLLPINDMRLGKLVTLLGVLTLEEKIRMFFRKFAPFFTVSAVPESVQAFLSTINSAKGNVSVRELAGELGYSERQLRRVVYASMGMSPKALCRIVRFQNAVHNLLAAPAEANLQYIGDLNYTDQAHFQREFKEFTGLSPRKFAALYA